ncbi:rhodanese-like domain-containing protein [Pontibacillus marinus]|uniref:Rhodanese domain-containing protein n=1 Tax=Pontibacillus marinus BH030004 = DSM 16465 TaxID=1385511 RepID=A0A0A5FXW3_9BACI|nr:rhodanese-like domain-containing protein [Pontibacillus marinus]KGX83673.1 hypothetical protein N783_01785 [Pontibacillus marinus BH030004 = DSM 16465]
MDEVKEITTKDLQEKLENNESLNIIDVREDEEVANGMIPTAKHIPLQQIPEAINDLDQDQEYIMVCRSGGRSMNAASFMNQHGYNTINMAGGMLDWDGEVVF